MKKIHFAFLFISSITNGQNDQRTKDSLALNAPTEIGTPDGELVSKKIGKDGGTLISSDNKITLIFPPGAIAAETLISIQPTTNFAKESIGKAYQFEPSGIQFQKPVQLVINYTDKELDEQSPQLLGVGSQNDKGEWMGIRTTKVDTTLKTVTANIKHFSGYALWCAILLIPEKTRIQVSHEMYIKLVERDVEPGDEPTEDLLTGSSFTNDKNWSVNAIPDGNSEFGWVKRYEGAPATMTGRLYKAPAKVPDHNSVEIKVEITNSRLVNPSPSMVNHEAFPTTVRKCHVRIFDNEYEVTMESSLEGSAGSMLGRVTYKDSGSFVVSLDRKEPEIIEIKNNKDSWKYFGKCDVVLKHSGNGLINIAGIRNLKIIPARPPELPYATVGIVFIPSIVEFSVLDFSCPNLRGGKTNMSSSNLVSMPALPISVSFTAKEGEQVLPGTVNVGGMYYKVTVKQRRDN